MNSTSQNGAENLRKFFADGRNTVTRERIFFNRLSFDLKIAAARADYHLHLYEPDVDRSGFDIVAEDDEYVGWFQTKAVLSSAGTGSWSISVDFLRPAIGEVNEYGLASVEAGRGGGVILIEIDDTTDDAAVTYRFTSFDIISAIANGFIIPKARKKSIRNKAGAIIQNIIKQPRTNIIEIPRALFITASGPDALLGMMGLQSNNGYGRFAVRQSRAVEIDANGQSTARSDPEQLPILAHHMLLLCEAQPGSGNMKRGPYFKPFIWMQPATG